MRTSDLIDNALSASAVHDRKLPGRPDIVFPGRRALIMIHGCFWHAHGCHLSATPATRREFWENKLRENRARDSRALSDLGLAGWQVLVIWECALRGRHRQNLADVIDACERFLNHPERRISEVRGSVAPLSSGCGACQARAAVGALRPSASLRTGFAQRIEARPADLPTAGLGPFRGDRRCSVSGLPIPELLQAARVIPDRDARGRPDITNGLCLSIPHHTAYDRNLLGIDPDGRIIVAESVLGQHDGPTLEAGIKGLHGQMIRLPRNDGDRPNRDHLAERLEVIRRVA